MPNYKPLTITAEVATLDKKLQSIKDVDEKLKKSNTPPLQQERAKLVTEIGQSVDKILAGADVAESNNRAYCDYIVQGHDAAKQMMDKMPEVLKRLETAWDDKLAFMLNQIVGQITMWKKKLEQDDKELRAVKMVDEYRGNGWKISITSALTYVPDRTGAFQTREKNRQDGIQLSTTVVGKRDRIGEYVTRAEAMEKGAAALLDKNMGADKDYLKLRDELFDFADSTEKDVLDRVGQLDGTLANANTKLKNALGVKVQTKDSVKPLLLIEPKLDSLLKDCKGRVKTLRTLAAELAKRAPVTDKRFKAPYDRANAAIGKLETKIDEYVKGLLPARKLIEQGKKLK